MNHSYILSTVADQDIDEIVTYLLQRNPESAEAFVDRLYSSFDMISENPMIGHLREDLTDHPVRFLTFQWHYLVIYKPIQPLEIVRVLSGYRDVVTLLSD